MNLKLGYKSAGGKIPSVKFASNLFTGSAHAFFLVVITSSLLLDSRNRFVLQLRICINVIGIHQTTGPTENNKKVETRKGLILSETVEMLVPLAYCSSPLTAYYGTNADIIGNVGNEYWHDKKIANLWKTLMKLGFFFFVDI